MEIEVLHVMIQNQSKLARNLQIKSKFVNPLISLENIQIQTTKVTMKRSREQCQEINRLKEILFPKAVTQEKKLKTAPQFERFLDTQSSCSRHIIPKNHLWTQEVSIMTGDKQNCMNSSNSLSDDDQCLQTATRIHSQIAQLKEQIESMLKRQSELELTETTQGTQYLRLQEQNTQRHYLSKIKQLHQHVQKCDSYTQSIKEVIQQMIFSLTTRPSEREAQAKVGQNRDSLQLLLKKFSYFCFNKIYTKTIRQGFEVIRSYSSQQELQREDDSKITMMRSLANNCFRDFLIDKAFKKWRFNNQALKFLEKSNQKKSCYDSFRSCAEILPNIFKKEVLLVQMQQELIKSSSFKQEVQILLYDRFQHELFSYVQPASFERVLAKLRVSTLEDILENDNRQGVGSQSGDSILKLKKYSFPVKNSLTRMCIDCEKVLRIPKVCSNELYCIQVDEPIQSQIHMKAQKTHRSSKSKAKSQLASQSDDFGAIFYPLIKQGCLIGVVRQYIRLQEKSNAFERCEIDYESLDRVSDLISASFELSARFSELKEQDMITEKKYPLPVIQFLKQLEQSLTESKSLSNLGSQFVERCLTDCLKSVFCASSPQVVNPFDSYHIESFAIYQLTEQINSDSKQFLTLLKYNFLKECGNDPERWDCLTNLSEQQSSIYFGELFEQNSSDPNYIVINRKSENDSLQKSICIRIQKEVFVITLGNVGLHIELPPIDMIVQILLKYVSFKRKVMQIQQRKNQQQKKNMCQKSDRLRQALSKCIAKSTAETVAEHIYLCDFLPQNIITCLNQLVSCVLLTLQQQKIICSVDIPKLCNFYIRIQTADRLSSIKISSDFDCAGKKMITSQCTQVSIEQNFLQNLSTIFNSQSSSVYFDVQAFHKTIPILTEFSSSVTADVLVNGFQRQLTAALRVIYENHQQRVKDQKLKQQIAFQEKREESKHSTEINTSKVASFLSDRLKLQKISVSKRLDHEFFQQFYLCVQSCIAQQTATSPTFLTEFRFRAFDTPICSVLRQFLYQQPLDLDSKVVTLFPQEINEMLKIESCEPYIAQYLMSSHDNKERFDQSECLFEWPTDSHSCLKTRKTDNALQYINFRVSGITILTAKIEGPQRQIRGKCTQISQQLLQILNQIHNYSIKTLSFYGDLIMSHKVLSVTGTLQKIYRRHYLHSSFDQVKMSSIIQNNFLKAFELLESMEKEARRRAIGQSFALWKNRVRNHRLKQEISSQWKYCAKEESSLHSDDSDHSSNVYYLAGIIQKSILSKADYKNVFMRKLIGVSSLVRFAQTLQTVSDYGGLVLMPSAGAIQRNYQQFIVRRTVQALKSLEKNSLNNNKAISFGLLAQLSKEQALRQKQTQWKTRQFVGILNQFIQRYPLTTQAKIKLWDYLVSECSAKPQKQHQKDSNLINSDLTLRQKLLRNSSLKQLKNILRQELSQTQLVSTWIKSDKKHYRYFDLLNYPGINQEIVDKADVLELLNKEPGSRYYETANKQVIFAFRSMGQLQSKIQESFSFGQKQIMNTIAANLKENLQKIKQRIHLNVLKLYSVTVKIQTKSKAAFFYRLRQLNGEEAMKKKYQMNDRLYELAVEIQNISQKSKLQQKQLEHKQKEQASLQRKLKNYSAVFEKYSINIQKLDQQLLKYRNAHKKDTPGKEYIRNSRAKVVPFKTFEELSMPEIQAFRLSFRNWREINKYSKQKQLERFKLSKSIVYLSKVVRRVIESVIGNRKRQSFLKIMSLAVEVQQIKRQQQRRYSQSDIMYTEQNESEQEKESQQFEPFKYYVSPQEQRDSDCLAEQLEKEFQELNGRLMTFQKNDTEEADQFEDNQNQRDLFRHEPIGYQNQLSTEMEDSVQYDQENCTTQSEEAKSNALLCKALNNSVGYTEDESNWQGEKIKFELQRMKLREPHLNKENLNVSRQEYQRVNKGSNYKLGGKTLRFLKRMGKLSN